MSLGLVQDAHTALSPMGCAAIKSAKLRSHHFTPPHQPVDALPLPASLASATTGCPLLLLALLSQEWSKASTEAILQGTSRSSDGLGAGVVPGVEGLSPQLIK